MEANILEYNQSKLSSKEADSCPDLEILAELMEGAMEPSLRDQTISHLKNCPDCKLLFADALEIFDDLPEEAFKVPSPLEWQNRHKRKFVTIGKLISLTIPVAAAAVFLVFRPTNTKWSAETMLEGINATNNTQVTELISSSSYQRGVLGFSEGLSKNKLYFKAGILTTQLELALQTKDLKESLTFANPLINLLKNQELIDQELSQILGGVNKLERVSNLRELKNHIREIETYIGQSSNRFFFQLGMSTEAGKLAALNRKKKFFQQNYFKELLEQEKLEQLPPGTIRKLQTIRELVINQKSTENFQKLYQGLEELQAGLL